MQKTIRIGTRKSKLALVQTHMVEKMILEAFPDLKIEICEMSTKGDELLDRSLLSFGGKGVFTQELEAALLQGQIDLAVHSAKDMPMEFPEGLGIGAVLRRGPVEDVIVTKDSTLLKDLKPGSVVGTGSLRRELQIKKINPLIRVKLIRGNVQTRLRKLEEGQYDAIVLAAAGLDRLELSGENQWKFEHLSSEVCLPAAGQAILAVESRNGDLREVLNAIHDKCAWVELCAERAFLKAIGGSCNAPAAGLAHLDDNGVLRMDALFAPDQKHYRRVSGTLETGFDGDKGVRLGEELAEKLMQGKVWLVGAGPGNMDLVTQKCLRCIRQADVIIYDSLATDSLLNEARMDAELIYAGKRADHHHLRQWETNALLIEKAKEGKNVVRLKGGDPFIFGRGGEEAQELRAAGIEYEIVCGVSSCYGAPAYAGIPVTHRDHASSFHVITGHEGNHKSGTVLDYATLAKEEGTLVFLMGLKNLPSIASNLIANGKDPKTPAAVIQEGTTARQRVVTGTLERIAEIAEEEQIKTPAITVVGDVVTLQKEIKWVDSKPLYGTRVLVTATEQMSRHLCEMLEEEGAEAVAFSLIETEPLHTEAIEKMAEEVESYSWIVLTSNNGVRIFFDALRKQGKDVRSLADLKFAVIGAATKEELEKHGIFADFVPSRYSSRELAAEWIPTLRSDEKVLLARAEEASEELSDALKEAGIDYEDVALYHTAVDQRKSEELNRILPQVDYVTLCSASAVRAYVSMLDEAGRQSDPRIICIGPVTERAARAAGLAVHQSAVVYTAEGIKDVLLYDKRVVK